MIGRLLGHSELQTTERYAHLAADWVKESAARISESIAAGILTGYPGCQNEPPRNATGCTSEQIESRSAPASHMHYRARAKVAL